MSLRTAAPRKTVAVCSVMTHSVRTRPVTSTVGHSLVTVSSDSLPRTSAASELHMSVPVFELKM